MAALPMLLLSTAGIAACDSASSAAGATGAAAAVVQDSAGVQIVTYTTADLDSARSQALADSTPLLRIGAVDGPEGTTLNGVRALVEGPSGGFALADNDGTVIRFYDGGGTYLGAQGGEGDGPGEYRSIMGLAYLSGDTLAVYDQGSARLSLISPDREFSRSVPLPIPPNRLGFSNDIYGLGSSSAVMLFQAPPDPGRLRDPNRNMEARVEQERFALLLMRLADSMVTVDTLDHVPGFGVYIVPRPNGEGRTGIRFGPRAMLASGASGFVVAHGSRFEVRRYGVTGSLVQIIRVDATPKPVTREDRAASGPQNERTAFADWHPLLRDIALDGKGNLWVSPDSSIAGDRGWIVFSPEGEIRGWVPHLSPIGWNLHVGSEFLYAGSTDVLDALYISKYRFVSP